MYDYISIIENLIIIYRLYKKLAEVKKNRTSYKRTKRWREDAGIIASPARRKEIYEALHPDTKQGMRNGQTAKTATGAVLEKTFAEDTAKFVGNNVADTVSAATTRARDMTSLQPDKTRLLMRLGKVPPPFGGERCGQSNGRGKAFHLRIKNEKGG